MLKTILRSDVEEKMSLGNQVREMVKRSENPDRLADLARCSLNAGLRSMKHLCLIDGDSRSHG